MNPNDSDRARQELERALEDGDPQTIVNTLLFNAWPLYSRHYELLISAIMTLPREIVEQNTLLAVVHPMTAVISRTVDWAPPAPHPDVERTLSPAQFDLLLLAYMTAHRLGGGEASALSYARLLAERIAETRVDSRDRADGPLWYYHQQIGSTLLSAGETSPALLEFSTARQLAALSIQPDAERVTLGRQALAHAVRGSLDDAERALSKAVRGPDPSPAHVRSATATESAAAALIGADRMSQDLDERIDALESYDSFELTWPFALLATVRVSLARNRPHDALEVLNLARQTHSKRLSSFAADVITSASVQAHIAADDISSARIAFNSPEAGQGPLTRLASTRLAIHTGDFESATLITRSLVADRTLGPSQRAECSVLTAWLQYSRSGDLDTHTATQVAWLGMDADNRRVFASVPSGLIDRACALVPASTAVQVRATLRDLHHVDARVWPHLTESEIRVLEALTVYDTIATIAAALHVSPNTIKSQIRSLYRKLDCSTRQEAIQLAADWHVLNRPGSFLRQNARGTDEFQEQSHSTTGA